MEHHCPNCQRVLYDRRLKCCGFCGATIPPELRFTPDEASALDREKAVIELFRQRRVEAEELHPPNFLGPNLPPYF